MRICKLLSGRKLIVQRNNRTPNQKAPIEVADYVQEILPLSFSFIECIHQFVVQMIIIPFFNCFYSQARAREELGAALNARLEAGLAELRQVHPSLLLLILLF